MHPFTRQLDGFTSDHTPQSIHVACYQQGQANPDLSVRGATWNMMNKCFSKANCKNRVTPFTNNPFDIDETAAQYEARRRQQFKDIKQLIQQGNDFILLQEADWIYNSSLSSHYRAELQKLGWELIRTPRPANGFSHQASVTLYNTGKLQYTGRNRGLFASQSNRYRAIETEFVERSSQKLVAIVNCHLEFDVDYRDAISTYQKQQTQKNIATVMGGDTNHPQNLYQESFIGNWHYATNIDCTSPPGGGAPVITDEDARVGGGQHIKKRYDGFFVNPTSSTYAMITECDGKYFRQDPQRGWQAAPFHSGQLLGSHAKHMSLCGHPWERFKYILKEMDTALGQERNRNAQRKIVTDMAAICQRMTGKSLAQRLQDYGLDHAASYLECEKAGFTDQNRPRVIHPEQYNPNVFTPGSVTYDFSASNNRRGLVFLEFPDSASAQQFAQKLTPHLQRPKVLQGRNNNVISFTIQDADFCQMDLQALVQPLLAPPAPAVAHKKQLTI